MKMGSLAMESVWYVVVSDRLALAVICENALPPNSIRLARSKNVSPGLFISKILSIAITQNRVQYYKN